MLYSLAPYTPTEVYVHPTLQLLGFLTIVIYDRNFLGFVVVHEDANDGDNNPIAPGFNPRDDP